MKLSVPDLILCFGYSAEAAELRSKLMEFGFSTDLSLPNFRKIGSQQFSDEARGISLMLSERAKFERLYGVPRSDGEGIFNALYAYPLGFKGFAPYDGKLGHSLENASTAAQLRRKLGPGLVKDEDEAIVYEETWQLEATDLFAKYAEDGTVISLQFNLPMRSK